jgi:hypothetical protein
MASEAHWHLPAYNEMLNLHLPREVSLNDAIAAIERWANAIAEGWSERSTDQVADLDYRWVFPQAKFSSVLLPDGQKWGLRDLRLFCLSWDPVPRICIVAVDPDGRRRIEEDFFGLLTRVEDAYFVHAEDPP